MWGRGRKSSGGGEGGGCRVEKEGLPVGGGRNFPLAAVRGSGPSGCPTALGWVGWGPAQLLVGWGRGMEGVGRWGRTVSQQMILPEARGTWTPEERPSLQR